MRIERTRELYERAIYSGDADALTEADHDLDAVEADLALARGRILHGRFMAGGQEDPRELTLFEQATRLYRELGDARGEGESLFWEGCFHQVVKGDDAAAVPLFERARELAAKAGDQATLGEALRHLGIAAHHAGRFDEARESLTESSRVRREAGLWAGVASNQVGLIYIAVAQGRHDDARALADEGRALAQSCGADRVLAQIDEAGAQIRG